MWNRHHATHTTASTNPRSVETICHFDIRVCCCIAVSLSKILALRATAPISPSFLGRLVLGREGDSGGRREHLTGQLGSDQREREVGHDRTRSVGGVHS